MAHKGLKRDISLLGAAFLVLNGLIGAGIYALPATMAEQAGLFSPWLFVIVGLMMIMVVLTFGELSSYFKDTGGPVLYADTAFGPLVGFQTGWLLYLGRMTALAANANVLVTYAAYLMPDMAGDIFKPVALVLLCAGLTAINVVGVKKAMGVINILTFLKLLPILMLIGLGLGHVSADRLLPSELPELANMGGTALLLMYAFIGFEGAVVTAGETKNPRSALPKALILTVVAITVLYFLIQLTYVSVMQGQPGGGSAPLVEMGRVLAGSWGALVIICAAIFSVGGNLTSVMVTAPRMTFAMAEEGSLPRWFGKIHPRYATPSHSIIFFGLITGALAVSGSFYWLAIISSLARMVAFAVCILSLPVIKKKASAEMRAHAIGLPGGYVIPFLGLILCVWAAFQSSADAWMLLLPMMAAGGLLYWAAKKIP